MSCRAAASPAVVAVAAALAAPACDSTPRAVSRLLDAFLSHQIVALGEGLHGNEQAHAFRLALVRHPGFPLVDNDIVVEFGTARYQAVHASGATKFRLVNCVNRGKTP